MNRSTFVYVTYIRTTPDKLWSALTTDREFMQQYWFGVHCESTWTAGAAWQMVQHDGKISDAGKIIEADPPRRLVIQWENRADYASEGPSICEMVLEPGGGAVKLTITHSAERETSKLIGAVSGGWPKVLSNLKSLLESGAVALGEPYPPKA